MKATEANLLKFLKKSPQFVIPIYQRNYSWTETQCRQLWADLMRAGRDDTVNAHFIGAIVYVERGLGNVVQQEALLVIDGQQRLTTSTLLIAALAMHFEDQGVGELLEAFSAKKLRNYYLLNPDEEGERHFKLLLSETDKETLLAILQKNLMPAELSSRIHENYKLFQELITQHQDELEAICQGIAKLVIVDVSLDRTQDNPQLIFESMNSTGLELSQADLIRNYILMGLEPKLQTELYKNYWRPMEKGFGQAAYTAHFDPFMRHYLTAKTGEIPNQRDVYVAFKNYARSLKGDIRALVADIHAYASYYCAMALGSEKEPNLKHAFHDLRELKVDVAYPFLLDAYHDYRQQRLTVEELAQIVRWVESYVFRRAICNIPTNSLNKTFAAMSRSLKKDRYLESVQAAFLLLPTYRRFPLDDEFQREIKLRNLYQFRSRSYWLRRLENYGRKERVVIEDYTIEHILPQNEDLSKEWQTDLGPDWSRIQQTWLHTLGNLTLTGYNSEYRDYPFEFKQNQATDINGDIAGFAASPLKLNNWKFELEEINDQTGVNEKKAYSLADVPKWNEDTILARAERLAIEAAKVWIVPQLEPDVLDAYRPSATRSGQQYSIEDHPYLISGPVRELFEAFRQAVLALDPCVTEEFLKLYVAYKAETNFVDVIPQAKRLLLVLNTAIEDIEDPKSLCRDISNIGRWGNGDVEVGLSSLEELPYVIGLIRQAFDQQMGNAGAN
ncbi:MAG: GmrSD restriction endonuclease domain-containing protein [Methylomicrobium sp.]